MSDTSKDGSSATELQDSSDSEKSHRKLRRNTKRAGSYSCRGLATRKRSGYSDSDDKKMLEFLAEQFGRNRYQPYGNQMWREAVRRKITGHSAQAMLNRVKRHLIPDLEGLVRRGVIDDPVKRAIEEGIKVNEALSKKKSGLTPKRGPRKSLELTSIKKNVRHWQAKEKRGAFSLSSSSESSYSKSSDESSNRSGESRSSSVCSKEGSRSSSSEIHLNASSLLFIRRPSEKKRYQELARILRSRRSQSEPSATESSPNRGMMWFLKEPNKMRRAKQAKELAKKRLSKSMDLLERRSETERNKRLRQRIALLPREPVPLREDLRFLGVILDEASKPRALVKADKVGDFVKNVEFLGELAKHYKRSFGEVLALADKYGDVTKVAEHLKKEDG